MTAFHNIILLSVGAPLTPAGGSSCNLPHVTVLTSIKCHLNVSKQRNVQQKF